MKMILIGKKSYCGQVLEWSLRKNIEILGVVTNDNCVVSIAKKYGIKIRVLCTFEDGVGTTVGI